MIFLTYTAITLIIVGLLVWSRFYVYAALATVIFTAAYIYSFVLPDTMIVGERYDPVKETTAILDRFEQLDNVSTYQIEAYGVEENDSIFMTAKVWTPDGHRIAARNAPPCRKDLVNKPHCKSLMVGRWQMVCKTNYQGEEAVCPGTFWNAAGIDVDYTDLQDVINHAPEIYDYYDSFKEGHYWPNISEIPPEFGDTVAKLIDQAKAHEYYDPNGEIGLNCYPSDPFEVAHHSAERARKSLIGSGEVWTPAAYEADPKDLMPPAALDCLHAGVIDCRTSPDIAKVQRRMTALRR